MDDLDSAQQNLPADEAGQQTGQEPGQEPGDQQTVPKERFDEVQNQLAAVQERLNLMEQNSALAAANAPQPTGEPAQAFDIYEHAGLGDDDDTISVGQAKKITEYISKTQQAQLDDLRFHVEHPDYNEIVGPPEKVKLGQFADPLAAAIKENPALLPTILGSNNPRQAAYAIGKAAASKKPADTKAAAEDDAENLIAEAVSNAERVKSSATVRGGSPLSDEGRYKNLDDAAFVELARTHGANV